MFCQEDNISINYGHGFWLLTSDLICESHVIASCRSHCSHMLCWYWPPLKIGNILHKWDSLSKEYSEYSICYFYYFRKVDVYNLFRKVRWKLDIPSQAFFVADLPGGWKYSFFTYFGAKPFIIGQRSAYFVPAGGVAVTKYFLHFVPVGATAGTKGGFSAGTKAPSSCFIYNSFSSYIHISFSNASLIRIKVHARHIIV
jgi:hypothetical protein